MPAHGIIGGQTVNTPRDFFEAYVMPAVADCEADPGAVHRTVSALCHIDALAEEVWHAKPQVATSSAAYRGALKSKLIELAYAWDVHDIRSKDRHASNVGTCADRSRISMKEAHQIRYWTEALGCSEDELAAAVARVGNSTDAVRRDLSRLGIRDIPTRRHSEDRSIATATRTAAQANVNP
jgi:hypothetical protein